jgi:hypothetical protein
VVPSLVQDINPGAGSSDPGGTATAGHGLLYFAATDNTHGRELWGLNLVAKLLYLPLIQR